jgi:hypothetical protein
LLLTVQVKDLSLVPGARLGLVTSVTEIPTVSAATAPDPMAVDAAVGARIEDVINNATIAPLTNTSHHLPLIGCSNGCILGWIHWQWCLVTQDNVAGAVSADAGPCTAYQLIMES